MCVVCTHTYIHSRADKHKTDNLFVQFVMCVVFFVYYNKKKLSMYDKINQINYKLGKKSMMCTFQWPLKRQSIKYFVNSNIYVYKNIEKHANISIDSEKNPNIPFSLKWIVKNLVYNFITNYSVRIQKLPWLCVKNLSLRYDWDLIREISKLIIDLIIINLLVFHKSIMS